MKFHWFSKWLCGGWHLSVQSRITLIDSKVTLGIPNFLGRQKKTNVFCLRLTAYWTRWRVVPEILPSSNRFISSIRDIWHMTYDMYYICITGLAFIKLGRCNNVDITLLTLLCLVTQDSHDCFLTKFCHVNALHAQRSYEQKLHPITVISYPSI